MPLSSPIQALMPTKLLKLVPSSSSWAMMALLSLAAETWQSEHCLVSVRRTVCGKCGAKAWLEKPAAEIGGRWTENRSLLMLVEDRISAEVERTGAMMLPLLVMCRPNWNMSSRATCGL